MADNNSRSSGGDSEVRELQRDIQFLKAELRDADARYASWKNVMVEECKEHESQVYAKVNSLQTKFAEIVEELKASLDANRKETVQTKEHNKTLIEDQRGQIQDCVQIQTRKLDELKEELTRSIKDHSRKSSKENASIAQAFLSRIDEERESMESAVQACHLAADQKLEKFKVQTNVQFMGELRSQKAVLTSAFSDGLAEQKEVLEASMEGSLAVLKDTMTQLFREEVAKQRRETEENFLLGIDKMESWLKGENARRDAELREIRETLLTQANELEVIEYRRLETKQELQDSIAGEAARIEGLLDTEKRSIVSLADQVEARFRETNEMASSMKEETMIKTSKMVKECLMLNVQLKALEDRCAKHVDVYESALAECARTKDDMQLSLENQNVVFQSYEDKILQRSTDFQAFLDEQSATVEDLHARFQDISEDLDRLQDKVLDQDGAIEATNLSLNRLLQDRAADNAQAAKIGKTWESLYAHLAAQLQDATEQQEMTWSQQQEEQVTRDMNVKATIDGLECRLEAVARAKSESRDVTLGLQAQIEAGAAQFAELRQSLGDLDQAKFHDLCLQIDYQTKMITHVQDERSRATAELDNIIGKITNLDRKIDDVSADVQTRCLETSLDEKLATLDGALTMQIERVNQATEKNRTRADRMREDVDKCVIKVDVLQGNLGAININMFNDLQKRVTDQTKQLMMDKQERSFAKDKITEIEKTIDERILKYARGEFTASQDEIRTLVDNTDRKLSRNIAVLKNQVEDVTNDHLSTKKRVEGCEKTFAVLSETSEHALASLLDLKAHVKNVELKADDVILLLDDKIANLATSDFVTSAVESCVANMEKHLTAVKNQVHLCRGVVKSLELGSSSVSQTVEDLRASLTSIDKEFGVLLSTQIESRRDIQAVSKFQIETRTEVGGFAASYEEQLRELKCVIAEVSTAIMTEVREYLGGRPQTVRGESEALKESASELSSQLNEQLESISEHVKGCVQESESNIRELLDAQQVGVDERLFELFQNRDEQLEQVMMLRDDVDQISTNIADIQATIEPAVATLSSKVEEQSRSLQEAKNDLSQVSNRSVAIDGKLSAHKNELKARSHYLEKTLKVYVDRGLEVALAAVSERTLETNGAVESLKKKVEMSINLTSEAVEELSESFTAVTDALERKLNENEAAIGRIDSTMESTFATKSFVAEQLERSNTSIQERHINIENDITAMKTDVTQQIVDRLHVVEQSGKSLKSYIDTRVEGCNKKTGDMIISFSSEVKNKISAINDKLEVNVGHEEESAAKVAAIESTLSSLQDSIESYVDTRVQSYAEKSGRDLLDLAKEVDLKVDEIAEHLDANSVQAVESAAKFMEVESTLESLRQSVNSSLESTNEAICEINKSLLDATSEFNQRLDNNDAAIASLHGNVEAKKDVAAGRIGKMEKDLAAVVNKHARMDSDIAAINTFVVGPMKTKIDEVVQNAKLLEDHVTVKLDGYAEQNGMALKGLCGEIDVKLASIEQRLKEHDILTEDSILSLRSTLGSLQTSVDVSLKTTNDAVDEVKRSLAEAVDNLQQKLMSFDTVIDSVKATLQESEKSLENHVCESIDNQSKKVAEDLLVLTKDVEIKLNTVKQQLEVYCTSTAASASMALLMGSTVDTIQRTMENAPTLPREAFTPAKGSFLDIQAELERRLTEHESAIKSLNESMTTNLVSREELEHHLKSIDQTTAAIVEEIECQLKVTSRALPNMEQRMADMAAAKISLLESAIESLQSTLDQTIQSSNEAVSGLDDQMLKKISDYESKISLLVDSVEDVKSNQEEFLQHLSLLGEVDTDHATKLSQIQTEIEILEIASQAQQDGLIGMETKLAVMDQSLQNSASLPFVTQENKAVKESMTVQITRLEEEIAAQTSSMGQRLACVEEFTRNGRPALDCVASQVALHSQELARLKENVMKELLGLRNEQADEQSTNLEAMSRVLRKLSGFDERLTTTIEHTNREIAEAKSIASHAIELLDKNVTELGSRIDHKAAEVDESIKHFVTEKCNDIKEQTTLTLETRIIKTIEQKDRELASTTAIASSAVELVNKNINELSLRIEQEATALDERVKSIVTDKYNELQDQINRSETRVTLEAETLKRSIGVDLENAVATLAGQVAMVQQQSASESETVSYRIERLDCAVRAGTERHDQLQAEIESHAADISQRIETVFVAVGEVTLRLEEKLGGVQMDNKSELDNVRALVQTGADVAETLREQIENLRLQATSNESFNSFAAKITEEAALLGSRIVVLDGFLKAESDKLTRLEQSVESRALGLQELVEQVDAKAVEAIESLDGRVSTLQSENASALGNFRGIMDSSMATLNALKCQVDSIQKETADESNRLTCLADSTTEQTNALSARIDTLDSVVQAESANVKQALQGLESQAATLANEIECVSQNTGEVKEQLSKKIDYLEESNQSKLESTRCLIMSSIETALELKANALSARIDTLDTAVQTESTNVKKALQEVESRAVTLANEIECVSQNTGEVKDQLTKTIDCLEESNQSKLESTRCLMSSSIETALELKANALSARIDTLDATVRTESTNVKKVLQEVESRAASLADMIESVDLNAAEVKQNLTKKIEKMEESSRSRLETTRCVLNANIETAMELKKQVDALQLELIEESKNVSSLIEDNTGQKACVDALNDRVDQINAHLKELIAKETAFLGIRIDGLDAFCKAEAERLTEYEQSEKSRAFAIEERAEKDDGNAFPAVESLTDRISTMPSENNSCIQTAPEPTEQDGIEPQLFDAPKKNSSLLEGIVAEIGWVDALTDRAEEIISDPQGTPSFLNNHASNSIEGRQDTSMTSQSWRTDEAWRPDPNALHLRFFAAVAQAVESVKTLVDDNKPKPGHSEVDHNLWDEKHAAKSMGTCEEESLPDEQIEVEVESALSQICTAEGSTKTVAEVDQIDVEAALGEDTVAELNEPLVGDRTQEPDQIIVETVLSEIPAVESNRTFVLDNMSESDHLEVKTVSAMHAAEAAVEETSVKEYRSESGQDSAETALAATHDAEGVDTIARESIVSESDQFEVELGEMHGGKWSEETFLSESDQEVDDETIAIGANHVVDAVDTLVQESYVPESDQLEFDAALSSETAIEQPPVVTMKAAADEGQNDVFRAGEETIGGGQYDRLPTSKVAEHGSEDMNERSFNSGEIEIIAQQDDSVDMQNSSLSLSIPAKDSSNHDIPETEETVEIASAKFAVAGDPTPQVESSTDPLDPVPQVESSTDPVDPVPQVELSTDPVDPTPQVESSTDPLDSDPVPQVESSTDPVDPVLQVELSTDPVDPTPQVESSTDPVDPTSPQVESSTDSVDPTPQGESSTDPVADSGALLRKQQQQLQHEESPEIVVVETIKKKVSIMAPVDEEVDNGDKTSSTKKLRTTCAVAKARRNDLRDALKALCEDLKGDVLPLLTTEEQLEVALLTTEEERDVAETTFTANGSSSSGADAAAAAADDEAREA